MMSYTGVILSSRVKEFLELAQPLPVSYGYPKSIKKADGVVTYRDISSTPRLAVGGGVISERKTYYVTVQTKTAEVNLFFSSLIKFATEGSYVALISEDMRKDTLVEDGWVNSIVLSAFNAMDQESLQYSKQEVRQILQWIANTYIFVTSIYRKTLATSFIDSLTVPELTKDTYSYEEVLQMKQEYLDKLLLRSVRY